MDVKLDADDLQKYEENGMAVVKAVESTGIDIRYDAKKKQRYPDTESAIRAQMPALFAPVRENSIVTQDNPDERGTIENYTVLHNGLNVGVTGYNTSGIVGEEFSVERANQLLIGGACVSFMPKGEETRMRITGVTIPDSSTGYITYNIVDYNCVINGVDVLSVPSNKLTGVTFRLNPSLQTNGHYFNRADTDANFIGDKTFKNHVYQNSISIPELIKGFLELCAQFGRVGRGGGEVKKLSKQNPVSIETSDVEDLWWDEYDVEQIGTVRYNIADTQSIVEYQIGNGGSVYDFGDNYFIKRIFASYTENNYTDAINLINSLIDQYFVPNVTDVPFVPVDMTMRGLPYVESGDYIVYDDETDQVGTYVLNREMDGVQTLFDDIESNGGEVMGK